MRQDIIQLGKQKIGIIQAHKEKVRNNSGIDLDYTSMKLPGMQGDLRGKKGRRMPF